MDRRLWSVVGAVVAAVLLLAATASATPATTAGTRTAALAAFAISRAAGWIAHCFEQRRANRIIRPQSEYIGPRGRHWVPPPQRLASA